MDKLKPLAGVVPAPHNPKDYTVSIPVQAAQNLPEKVDLRKYTGDIENQGHTGSCTANATVSALEWLLQKAGRPEHLSRLFIYFNEREEYQNLRGVDAGAYLSDGFKSVAKFGVPPESVWGFDESKVNTKPSDYAYSVAINKNDIRYEKVGKYNGQFGYPMQELIKATLAMGYPVTIAMLVHPDIFYLRGKLYEPSCKYNTVVSTTADYVGGHAMCLVGYDNSLGGFIAENSWGTSWGDSGFGILGYEALNQQLFDAWACTGFDGIRYEPDWSFMPTKPMTLSLENSRSTQYLGGGDQGAKFVKAAALHATVKDGSPKYNYKWTASDPDVLFMYSYEYGIPLICTDSWAPNETRSITMTCEVTDCSIPQFQVASSNTTIRVCNAVNVDTVYGQCYRLYQAVFNRKPDAPGLAYWILQMEAGMDLYTVAANFIGSKEFTDTYGNTDNSQFVRLLYKNVLKREPDVGGLNYWVIQLEGGISRHSILVGFSESSENKANVKW